MHLPNNCRTQNDHPLPTPQIPAPATAHSNGLSSTPTPTTANSFGQQQQAQPRPRERDVPLPSPVVDAPFDASAPPPAVKVPPVAGQQGRGHRRSHSLTATSTNTWSPGARRERKLSGLKTVMGEMGEKPPGPSDALPHSPGEEKSEAVPPSSPPPATPTLIRRFGTLFAGDGSSHKNRRLSLFGGNAKDGFNEHGAHGHDDEPERTETDTDTAKATRERKIQIVESEREREREKTGGLSHSASQPLSSNHRRAATVIDPSSRKGAGHDRRASAIAGFGIGRSSTVKRPSTATDSTFAQGRFRPTEHGDADDSRREHTASDKEDDAFKPIYMKGLFRYVFLFTLKRDDADIASK